VFIKTPETNKKAIMRITSHPQTEIYRKL